MIGYHVWRLECRPGMSESVHRELRQRGWDAFLGGGDLVECHTYKRPFEGLAGVLSAERVCECSQADSRYDGDRELSAPYVGRRVTAGRLVGTVRNVCFPCLETEPDRQPVVWIHNEDGGLGMARFDLCVFEAGEALTA